MVAVMERHSIGRAWDFLREALGSDHKDFTSGTIGRALWLLAIPMMLEMTMESVFAIVDIFFVARLGADAVTAVGLTEAVITVVYAIAIGLSMSTTAMVARRVGEGREGDAAVVAGQALWAGLVCAAAISLVGLLFATDLLQLMGASAEVVEQGSGYTTVLLGGSVTILYLFLINAVFRGAGDPSIAMRSLWLANGINIVLDPCLIYGLGPFPEMGVTGAATATTIGRGIGVVYQVYSLFGGRCRVQMGLKHLRLARAVMLRLLRISIGGILQFVIATSSWIVLVRIIAVYGSSAVAGYTIALRMFEFTFLPAWGMGNAAATLVGQNLGAGNPERAERSTWRAAIYNAWFLGVVSVLMIIFAEPLIRLFMDDPTVISYGVDCLRIISYGYAVYGVGMVLMQALNGAGDTETPTVLNFICYWMIQLPLAYVLAEWMELGPRGAFLSILVGETLLTVLSVFAFRWGRWKRKVV